MIYSSFSTIQVHGHALFRSVAPLQSGLFTSLPFTLIQFSISLEALMGKNETIYIESS